MRYTKSQIQSASEILDKWIIADTLSEDDCFNQLCAIGVSYNDANDMMNIVNHGGIKDCYYEIQEFSKDYDTERNDSDYEDHYEEYLKTESGIYKPLI